MPHGIHVLTSSSHVMPNYLVKNDCASSDGVAKECAERERMYTQPNGTINEHRKTLGWGQCTCVKIEDVKNNTTRLEKAIFGDLSDDFKE